MKVAEGKYEDRQPPKAGCSQKVSAEQREYAKASNCTRTAENNNTDTTSGADGLLERILDRNNLNTAYKRVKSNKGAGGVDKMSVDELLPYLIENRKRLIEQIRDEKYKPNPVRRVEIPKEEKGEVRLLGIPTVVDRVIQQAITQVLTPMFEPQFSENSFGFRPKRGAHDALKQCKRNVDDGYDYVVDMDLEKFFDTVCQSKLIETLSKTIKDGRVISLIHKYLNAGVVRNGLFERTEVGVPQGGPLSPLLSNIMLNELDRELERRGHRFVRYADDCMIFCKSRKAAERTLGNIVLYIEKKLFLKVNRDKTMVSHISKVKYLGYAFYRYKGECRFRIHPKSVKKMQNKIRELMKRSNGWGNEYRKEKLRQFIVGWINYFKLADMKSLLLQIDEWLRRKIRAVYWKQWKKTKTRYKMISKYGLPKWKVQEMANCRKGIWRAAVMLNSVLTNKEIASQGFITMTDYYLKMCCVN
ncbi:group II intron reverse transcriptase/maturase [Bacteroidia bacterium]|nr:group II intron reverse transcriptase/maturase [Bacteroidia bacterium]